MFVAGLWPPQPKTRKPQLERGTTKLTSISMVGGYNIVPEKLLVKQEGLPGHKCGGIASGASTNFYNLRYVGWRDEIGERREGTFAITLPGDFGSFGDLINAFGSNLNITEFNYGYRGGRDGHLLVGVQAACIDDISTIMDRLQSGSYRAHDRSSNEMAKLLITHSMGENITAREFQEKLVRFEVRKRRGALLKCLVELLTVLNITMFHCINHGAVVGRVPVGLRDWVIFI